MSLSSVAHFAAAVFNPCLWAYRRRSPRPMRSILLLAQRRLLPVPTLALLPLQDMSGDVLFLFEQASAPFKGVLDFPQKIPPKR